MRVSTVLHLPRQKTRRSGAREHRYSPASAKSLLFPKIGVTLWSRALFCWPIAPKAHNNLWSRAREETKARQAGSQAGRQSVYQGVP